MVQPLPQEYYQLLEELQAVDFVLIELTLYLDTHPHCKDALKQYNQFVMYHNQVKQSFESKFGPLLHGANPSSEEWAWSETPWPWQV